jgi:hypothetical protein
MLGFFNEEFTKMKGVNYKGLRVSLELLIKIRECFERTNICNQSKLTKLKSCVTLTPKVNAIKITFFVTDKKAK